MSLLAYLIVLLFTGLVVGALGRLLVPGRDPMGVGATILVGIAASFFAGLVSWAVFGRNGAGIILSVLCAMLIVWLLRRTAGPGRRSARPRRRGRGRCVAGALRSGSARPCRTLTPERPGWTPILPPQLVRPASNRRTLAPKASALPG